MRVFQCFRPTTFIIAAIVFCCLSNQTAYSQATRTSALLRGTITDPSGALLGAVQVTATESATGVSTSSATDASGHYSFNNLHPGIYALKATAEGFTTMRQVGIVLGLGQQAELDFKLEVGGATTSITVEGSVPVLNTVSAAVSQDVETKLAIDLPLFDRRITNLALLTPGVTSANGGSMGGALANNFSSNGQRNSTAEARIDGVLSTTPETGGGGVNFMMYVPSPEIVQEFKVQTSSFSAEYGSNGGTAMSLITKSGTNSFHGSAFYFGRRPQMDAADWLNNFNHTGKADYKRDNFGGVVDGPILKNKLFFLVGFDRVMFDQSSLLVTTVPTAQQKSGDFSKTFNQDGSLKVIYNPDTAHQITNTDGSLQWVRDPFPGNNINSYSRLDPVGRNVQALYPDPIPGLGNPLTNQNNYAKTGIDALRQNTYDLKMDYYHSDRQRLTGRTSFVTIRELTPVYFHSPVDSAYNNNTDNVNATLEHNWTINNKWIWSNQLGLNRNHNLATPAFPNDPTKLGFPSVLNTANSVVGMPSIIVGGYQNMNWGSNYYTKVGATLIPYSSTVSRTLGKHDLKFGGEVRWWLANFTQPGIPNGLFGFFNGQTQRAVYGDSNSYLEGDGIASLQLGYSGWSQINIVPGTATKSRETAFFLQDDWRVSERLTVNMGLRYEWSDPFTERHNRTGIANWKEDSGVNVPGLGEIKGVIDTVSSSHRTVGADRNNIAPRLGFAYRLDEKSVLRGGAGVYYGLPPVGQNNWYTAPQYRAYSNANYSLDGGITRTNATLANPWPNGLAYPQGKKYGKLGMWGYGGDNSNSFSTDPIRNAEIYQWNIGVQHQFGKKLTAEVTYVGNRSTHLPIASLTNRNLLPESVKQSHSLDDLNTQVPNPFLSMFVGPNATFNEPASFYNNPTVPKDWLLRPFPQFAGNFAGDTPAVAYSRYNALQARLEQHFSGGLGFVANYTFSHGTDNSSEGQAGWLAAQTGYQDPLNLAGEASVGASDVPHHLSIAAVYELPFGKGMRFASSVNRITNGFIGGWQVNGIYTVQSGFPLNLGMANSRLSDGGQRPNIVSGAKLTSGCNVKTILKNSLSGGGNGLLNGPTCQSFYNPAAFSNPGEQHYGNSPRYNGNLRAPGVNNMDFSLFKNLGVGEGRLLQLRGEAFNAFNRTQVGGPWNGWCQNADPSSASSCGFGNITGIANSSRRMQVGARFQF